MREIELDYRPTGPQRLFHASSADEVLFGGAAGGGKSRALVMEALIRCLEHAGTQAYLFRRTYRELEDTLIAEALSCYPRQLYKYSAAKHEAHLVNGSIIRFRHCQNEKDRFLYQGAEIHYLFIDELTHFTRAIYDFLKSRLRAKVTLGIRPIVRCASNPGGIGHAWVKAHFVDIGAPGEVHERMVESKQNGFRQRRSIQYIPALAMQNPHIGRDYIIELEQKPTALREALLNGRWDAFEGQAFPELRDNPQGYETGQWSHVIAPFEVPREWPRYRSFDFGYARPFSVGWWACGPEGEVYRYREWYGASSPNQGLRMDAKQIAEHIRKTEEAHEPGLTISGIADPSIWDSSRGESIAEQMQSEGVFFLPGENARLSGKLQLHSRLRMDEEGRPGLYVFANCRDWVRTIGSLSIDPVRVEDVDTRGEDHAYDETRYFLMARPWPGAKAKDRKAYNPLDG